MRAHHWLLCLVCLLFLTGLARDRFDAWVDATDLPPLLSEQSTEIRDREGTLLRVYTVADGRWRMGVRPDQVDAGYLDMLIAYEDRRFHRHAGVDPLALLRAGAQMVRYGQVVSGASTLTMQVARLLEESGTGQIFGKLRQMRVALALERHLSKEQILELYLTHAPYGGNLEGVRAATLAWFGKEPARLTPAEAALLVALPQSPETRRPDRHLARATDARERVLQRMQRAGLLSEEEGRAALSEPVPATRRPFPSLAPHLGDLLRAERPRQLRHDLTLDAGLQARLEALAATSLNRLPEELSIAIVVANHVTGEVLGSVGSGSYGTARATQGFVDMTRAKRSPGSTLKPLVYAMGFDRGLAHPQTVINDRPVAFGGYAPQNFDGAFRGELPVAEALRLSLNIPVVVLLNEIGPAHLMSVMRRAGAEPHLPGDQAGLAVALGGVGVSLNELVQLYAMLAQGGQARALHWQVGEGTPPGAEVLGPAATWHVGDILASLAPPQGAPEWRLAYKTGTSYGYRDAWAVGYDGRHVAGVWVGRPDGTPVPGAFGGDVAAPILFEAFQHLKPQADPLAPPPPETLILTTAELPRPLQRFIGRNAIFEAPSDAPKLIFPPDGAILQAADSLPVKLRDGKPPFTWLANGVPVRLGEYRRETTLPAPGAGFSEFAVIDAQGRTARVTVQIQ